MADFNLPETSTELLRTSEGLTLAILGSVRAWRNGVELDVGSPQQRVTLAVLTRARGRVVQVPEIIAALWGAQEPQAARGTVRTYVHRLRRAFDDGPDTPNPLRSVGNGYQLKIDDQASDLGRFLAARQAATEARANGDARRAVALLHEATAEWTGDAFAGLPGEWVETERQHLTRLNVQSIETLAELELELGHGKEVVERLTALAEAEPLRERVHELLMLALYRANRPAEALTVFKELRVTLRDALGVDPGPSVRKLHKRILNADSALLPTAPSGAAPSPAGPAVIHPAQLPSALPTFVGRRAELDELTDRLAAAPVPGVVVVHGTAGVGKTTFAAYWANHAAPTYPDGQLYVNLRGFEAGDARQPEEVLAELLDALGVSKANRPTNIDALTALYRSALAERRVLVLLDNARTSRQVLPLLPGGKHCLAIITSRVELTSLLATTGAYALTLDLMDDQESIEFMAARLGWSRVAAEPAAAHEIADICARLPLAMAVACARIANNPRLSLSDAVHQATHQAENRLDVLESADPNTDLRTQLSWSYRALTAEAARLFRSLSLLPRAEFTPRAAASLMALPLRQTTALMHELTRAYLLMPHRGRYIWHNLLRDYAQELLEETDRAEEIHAMQRRLFDHYLLLAQTGTAGMDPHNEDLPPPLEIAPGVLPGQEFDEHSAVVMFNDTYETMLALIRRAAETGFEQHAWRLTWFLGRYLDRSGRVGDLGSCNEIALRAAQGTRDLCGVGYAHRGLARVTWWHNDIDTCLRYLDNAFSAFASIGNHLAEAYTHRQAIGVLAAAGQTEAALARLEQARELLHAETRLDLDCALLSLTAECLFKQGRYEEAIHSAHVVRERNLELRNTNNLSTALKILTYSHAYLGKYREAIQFMEQKLEIQQGYENFAGPNYAMSLRGQLTVEMIQFGHMLFAADEHKLAEQVQHEALRRLRSELTDTWSATDLDPPGRDRDAVLADLDALLAVDQPDHDWHLACEAIFRRADKITNSLGSLHWLDELPPAEPR